MKYVHIKFRRERKEGKIRKIKKYIYYSIFTLLAFVSVVSQMFLFSSCVLIHVRVFVFVLRSLAHQFQ